MFEQFICPYCTLHRSYTLIHKDYDKIMKQINNIIIILLSTNHIDIKNKDMVINTLLSSYVGNYFIKNIVHCDMCNYASYFCSVVFLKYMINVYKNKFINLANSLHYKNHIAIRNMLDTDFGWFYISQLYNQLTTEILSSLK